MAKLRLMIADDHELIRRGLRDLLASQAGWKVVGEACDGVEAVEMAHRLNPDIAILDFFMPRLTGPQAAVQISEKLPEVGFVILTMDDSEEVIQQVVQAGVRGMVLKSDAGRDLVDAIMAVAEHRHFFTARISQAILSGFLSGKQERSSGGETTPTILTEREIQVMRLLAEGMTSREMALKLAISTRTVESHRTNISRKLSLGSVADLVRYAIRKGLVSRT